MTKTRSAPFDLELLRELSNILRDTDLTEIEIEHGELRLRVARQTSLPQTTQISVPAQAMPSTPQEDVKSSDKAKETTGVIEDPNHEGIVKSPMVGTVYLKPNPDSKSFALPGDQVKEGDTLLLIEAMKTFNPVHAHKAGIIKKFLVEDAQPVEYGEALVLIEE